MPIPDSSGWPRQVGTPVRLGEGVGVTRAYPGSEATHWQLSGECGPEVRREPAPAGEAAKLEPGHLAQLSECGPEGTPQARAATGAFCDKDRAEREPES